MGYIRDKLEPENQKYYYLQVLKILNNNGYKTISKDELRNELVLYRQKIFSNQINGNVKKKKKEENKDANKDSDDTIWINQQNEKRGIFFKVFAALLPLAYIVNYAYANFKA